jgi:hypothetical protein
MKKEHVLVIIIGLFLLSYVLDAVVNPLNIELATPYHFLDPKYLVKYPFTTASIVIKALGIFLTPLLLMSLFEGHHTAKGAVLLVLIALMQLYSLQDLATGAETVPLEWALSISVAGIALALPMLAYFGLGGLSWLHQSLGGKEKSTEDYNYDSDEEEEEE